MKGEEEKKTHNYHPLRAYMEAFEIDPTNVNALIKLAKLYKEEGMVGGEGKKEEVMKLYRKVVSDLNLKKDLYGHNDNGVESVTSNDLFEAFRRYHDVRTTVIRNKSLFNGKNDREFYRDIEEMDREAETSDEEERNNMINLFRYKLAANWTDKDAWVGLFQCIENLEGSWRLNLRFHGDSEKHTYYFDANAIRRIAAQYNTDIKQYGLYNNIAQKRLILKKMINDERESRDAKLQKVGSQIESYVTVSDAYEELTDYRIRYFGARENLLSRGWREFGRAADAFESMMSDKPIVPGFTGNNYV